MQYIDNIIFLICLVVGIGFFVKSMKEIYRNIMLGKAIDRTDHPKERWETMARVALGQSKMVKRPVAGILHIFVYVGFVIINLELIEIFVDGLFGTHRFLESIFGAQLYSIFTATLEVLAFLVVFAVVIFFIRRNIVHIKRLNMKELFGWPKHDANWILVIEFFLMMAFFSMNSSDLLLQERGVYHHAGYFPRLPSPFCIPAITLFVF